MQEELVVEQTQESDGDEVDEWAGDSDEGKPWHLSASPCVMLVILLHQLWTPEGKAMGLPPNMPFGFELDDIHVHIRA